MSRSFPSEGTSDLGCFFFFFFWNCGNFGCVTTLMHSWLIDDCNHCTKIPFGILLYYFVSFRICSYLLVLYVFLYICFLVAWQHWCTLDRLTTVIITRRSLRCCKQQLVFAICHHPSGHHFACIYICICISIHIHTCICKPQIVLAICQLCHPSGLHHAGNFFSLYLNLYLQTAICLHHLSRLPSWFAVCNQLPSSHQQKKFTRQSSKVPCLLFRHLHLRVRIHDILLRFIS